MPVCPLALAGVDCVLIRKSECAYSQVPGTIISRVGYPVVVYAIGKQGTFYMSKLVTLAAAAAIALASVSYVSAKNNAGNSGASKSAPGQMMRKSGSISGHRGASGYAPGHLKRTNGAIAGYPGASGYAPGHQLR
jgi:hypothetical protein